MQYNMESKIGKQNKRCKKEGVKKNFFLFFISTLTPLFENKWNWKYVPNFWWWKYFLMFYLRQLGV